MQKLLLSARHYSFACRLGMIIVNGALLFSVTCYLFSHSLLLLVTMLCCSHVIIFDQSCAIFINHALLLSATHTCIASHAQFFFSVLHYNCKRLYAIFVSYALFLPVTYTNQLNDWYIITLEDYYTNKWLICINMVKDYYHEMIDTQLP